MTFHLLNRLHGNKAACKPEPLSPHELISYAYKLWPLSTAARNKVDPTEPGL